MPIDKDSFDEFLGTIRRFVRERLIPNEARVAEDDAIPDDIVADMKSLGLFGLAIPEDYGGLGLSMEEEVLVIFEIARASPAFRSYFATNVGIGSQAIVMDGTEEQKRRYLPRLASGEIIGSFALTEPNSGSDAASLQTTARRDGDFYVLNGTKRFITNAPEAGVFTVMARTDPDKKGADGISAFVVDRDTAGLTVGKPDRKMGQRGAHTADVIFENCRVPRDAVIGGVEGQGFKQLMATFESARIQTAARAVGVAQSALELGLKYAIERKQFGQEIFHFPRVSNKLVMIAAELMAARQITYFAARRKDSGKRCDLEAGMAKLLAARVAWAAADNALQIHGGNGFAVEYPISRVLADARILNIFEGAGEIQAMVIGRRLLEEGVN